MGIKKSQGDGFIAIPNEMWDALIQLRIPGEANQVYRAIIRKTLGWNKNSDWISLSQIEQMTGLSRASVCRAVNRLEHMGLVSRKKATSKTTSYRLVTDCKRWRVVAKTRPQPKVVAKTRLGSRNSANKVVAISRHTTDITNTLQHTIPVSLPPVRILETIPAELHPKSKPASNAKQADRFERLWEIFPKRSDATEYGLRSQKRDAKREFAKLELTNDGWRDIQDAAKAYAKEKAVKRGLAKELGNWLRGDYWRDWIPSGIQEEDLPLPPYWYRLGVAEGTQAGLFRCVLKNGKCVVGLEADIEQWRHGGIEYAPKLDRDTVLSLAEGKDGMDENEFILALLDKAREKYERQAPTIEAHIND